MEMDKVAVMVVDEMADMVVDEMANMDLVWYDEEWKRIFGGRGDGAGSGRVLELRRGGWDVLVG